MSLPKKNRYTPVNTILLYKSGVQGGILFMDMCNVYPLERHFYIAKLGYAGV